MTIEDAKTLNQAGIATGGCWRCIANENLRSNRGPRPHSERGRTQWRAEELVFIGHRQFCPEHFRQEMEGSRDF